MCVTFKGVDDEIKNETKHICMFLVRYSKKSVAFHLLIMTFYIYIKSRFPCKEAARLRHRISTVAQNVDLFGVL